MNRIKKLIRNIILIFIILISFYYYGGFFLSKENLIKDKLKSLYSSADEYVLEFNKDNYYKTLYVDFNTMSYSLIGTQKIGILWKADGSSSGNLELNRSFDIEGGYCSNIGTYIIIYRNNKNIDYIQYESENGESYVFNDWNKDFIGIRIDDDSFNKIYKAYDANHNLIEEIAY